jgi:hypothetical protein
VIYSVWVLIPSRTDARTQTTPAQAIICTTSKKEPSKISRILKWATKRRRLAQSTTATSCHRPPPTPWASVACGGGRVRRWRKAKGRCASCFTGDAHSVWHTTTHPPPPLPSYHDTSRPFDAPGGYVSYGGAPSAHDPRCRSPRSARAGCPPLRLLRCEGTGLVAVWRRSEGLGGVATLVSTMARRTRNLLTLKRRSHQQTMNGSLIRTQATPLGLSSLRGTTSMVLRLSIDPPPASRRTHIDILSMLAL